MHKIHSKPAKKTQKRIICARTTRKIQTKRKHSKKLNRTSTSTFHSSSPTLADHHIQITPKFPDPSSSQPFFHHHSHPDHKPKDLIQSLYIKAASSSSTSVVSHASISDAHLAFGQTNPNTTLFYPDTFSHDDILLIERFSKQNITTFSLKGLLAFGHPHVQNAMISASFLFHELPARYAQRIELLRDAPFDLNRHPLLQQIQYHYLQSLRLITSIKKAPTTAEELHQFNKTLLQLIYQSSLLPSSVLSNSLCTAFSDILLQQLILLQHILPFDSTHQQKTENPKLEVESRRRSIAGIIDDSSTSLQLFNSLLQEVLDSFNVSRLDTRLLMTQHIVFCNQLFKQLDIEVNYMFQIDPTTPHSHDEFGSILGPDLVDFFSQHSKYFISSTHLDDQTNNINDGKSHNDDLGSFLSQQTPTSFTAAPSTPLSQSDLKHLSQLKPKHSFNIREGYDGFVGICQLKLQFADVVASVLPYSSFQAATRYVEYSLFQEYHDFYHTGIIGEKTQKMAKVYSPDDPTPIAPSTMTLQALISHLHLMNFNALDGAKHKKWINDAEELLLHQLQTQLKAGQKHHLVHSHDSVLLELPPIELTIPTLASLHKHFDQQLNVDGQNDLDKSISNTDPHDDHVETVDILVPISKVRLSGDLSHTILYSRSHASMIMREVLSNSVEATLLNTFQLTNTRVTEHLERKQLILHQKKLFSDGVTSITPVSLLSQQLAHLLPKHDQPDVTQDQENFLDFNIIKSLSSTPSNLDNSKNNFTQNIVTMGSELKDWNILHQHTHLPPVDMWLVKASSEVINAHKIGEKTHDKVYDIFSIKVSDRANGMTRLRSKAILTYGHKLIDNTLRTIRTYKQQQEQLHQYNQHVEQLRALHYAGIDSSHIDIGTNSPENDNTISSNIPPFIPPPLPDSLHPSNLITVHIPTADSYPPDTLMQMGGMISDTSNQPNSTHLTTVTSDSRTGTHTLDGKPNVYLPRGFGLPLAKATVNYLNGDFSLNSVDGFGTDIYLKLKV